MGFEAEYYDQYICMTDEEFIRKTLLENPKELERAAKIASFVPADADSILDVGCGGGLVLNTIAEVRPNVRRVGLERSHKTAEMARSLFDLEVVDGSADALPFEDDSFDVVMANEILEHLPWGVYQKTLTELERVARRMILITTPYRERRQFVTCPKCNCRFSPFYHVRSFSDAALGGLFDEFERVQQELIWVKGRAPLLYEARRFKATLGFVPTLPRHTICPQCGFRHQSSQSDGDARPAAVPNTSSTPSVLSRLVTATWGLIPRPRRAKWALVVYASKSA
jgi:SAM-dependent methyltransferase